MKRIGENGDKPHHAYLLYPHGSSEHPIWLKLNALENSLIKLYEKYFLISIFKVVIKIERKR